MLFSLGSSAESLDSLVLLMSHSGIQHNALKAQNEAAIAANHTGLSLADPSVGYNHLWGSPHDVGQRNDVSVSQSFDFATISGTKRREAKAKDQLADAIYQRSTLSLQQEVLILLLDIATSNKVKQLHAERIAAYETLMKSCRKRVDAGDASKLDLSKATLALASLKADAGDAETARQQLLCSPLIVTTLNDSQRACLQTITTEMIEQTIKRMAPATRVTEAEVEEMRRQVGVAKAELDIVRTQNLPELTAGFMAELTREEKFKGLSFGVNIPLWNNSSRIRSAKAQVVAAEADNQQKIEAIAARRMQYRQLLVDTKEQCEDIRRSLSVLSDANRLLLKAYVEGELSMTEYLLEQDSYYEMQFRYVELQAKHLNAMCLYEDCLPD